MYASAPLLASLFAAAKFLSLFLLAMSLLLKYNTFYLLAGIALKLGLQSTEEYFSYIAYAFFVFFYYVRRSVLFKIHAANIEASKFFVLFLSVTMKIYS